MNLHSNMFLLIPEFILSAKGFYLFTFQYVSINTLIHFCPFFTLLSFTFQYVSINTVAVDNLTVRCFVIYIPICFY